MLQLINYWRIWNVASTRYRIGFCSFFVQLFLFLLLSDISRPHWFAHIIRKKETEIIFSFFNIDHWETVMAGNLFETFTGCGYSYWISKTRKRDGNAIMPLASLCSDSDGNSSVQTENSRENIGKSFCSLINNSSITICVELFVIKRLGNDEFIIVTLPQKLY